jgi:hypothetical protein
VDDRLVVLTPSHKPPEDGGFKFTPRRAAVRRARVPPGGSSSRPTSCWRPDRMPCAGYIRAARPGSDVAPARLRLGVRRRPGLGDRPRRDPGRVPAPRSRPLGGWSLAFWGGDRDALRPRSDDVDTRSARHSDLSPSTGTERSGWIAPRRSRWRGRSNSQSGSTAPGNYAPIGVVTVIAEDGRFAARPSGTEGVHKLHPESFLNARHLKTHPRRGSGHRPKRAGARRGGISPRARCSPRSAAVDGSSARS